VNTVATWFSASGVQTGTLNVPAGHYESAAISPDGMRAVMVKSTSPSVSSLWLVDLARGGAVPLSTGPGRNDSPVWSPDGNRVVWAADREGAQNLYIKNVNDAAPEALLFASDNIFKAPVAWSPDGNWIVLVQLDPDTSQNMWLLDPSGRKPPTVLVRTPKRDPGGTVSPDSKWLSFTSDDSGRFQLFVQPFPSGQRKQVSENGGLISWWSRDSRKLVYVSDDNRTLWQADVQPQPGPAMSVGTPRQLGQLPADTMWVSAMPDLQRFLVITPERVGAGSITIVKNWRAALDKK
jgi:Tol biopolymer transport system component